MAKHIEFNFFGKSPSGKTKRWEIRSKQGNTVLGWVSWFSKWRKYAFAPAAETVFEEDCLRDIAEFCEKQTKDHKEG